MFISAVVTTTGRPSLDATIQSILGQTLPVAELIVVRSPGCESAVAQRLSSEQIRYLDCATRNANDARMLGISMAKGEVIALCDDDDIWLPSKIENQVREFADAGLSVLQPFVIGSRYRLNKGRSIRIAPTSLIQDSSSVADYLLNATTFRYGGKSMPTSTLFFPKHLVSNCPWEAGLERHQDWDWLISVAVKLNDCRFSQLDSTDVEIRWSSGGRSISRAGGWEKSEKWFSSALESKQISKRNYFDGLAAVTYGIAMREEASPSAIYGLLLRAIKGGRPGISSFVFLSPRMVWLAIRRLISARRI